MIVGDRHKHKKPGENRYFLSFTEECVLNPKYADYIGGRLEVTGEKEMYGKEYRFLTKKQEEFFKFRDSWDMKRVSAATLRRVLHKMKTEFLDNPEEVK